MMNNKIVLSALLLIVMSSCNFLEKSNLKEIAQDIRTEKRSNDNAEEQYVPQEMQEGEVYDMVDEMPVFPGGMTALLKYVSETIQYPDVAKKESIQGRVIVTFIVDKEGTIKNAKVMRGIDASLDNEALRVVNSMPRWNPGKHKGENVSVRFTFPVRFDLDE